MLAELRSKISGLMQHVSFTVVSLRRHGRTNRCVVTSSADECDPHSDAARCIRWDYCTKGSRRAEPRLKNSSCHQSRVAARCVRSHGGVDVFSARRAGRLNFLFLLHLTVALADLVLKRLKPAVPSEPPGYTLMY